MRIVELSGDCSAGGVASIEASERVNGFIEKIVMDYIDGDTGSDLTFTAEGEISEPVLTITNAF